MGKGDKRSFKGKVFKGSYGKTRLRADAKKKGMAGVKAAAAAAAANSAGGARRKAG
jgi:ribosomal small subunit protein bTHX